MIDRGAFQLVRIGHVCATVLGKMLQRTSQAPRDQRVPYLRAGLLDGLSDARELPFMYAASGEVQAYGVIEGDLLVAEGGDMGRSEFTPRFPERTIFQNSLHRIRLRSDGDIRFVRYALMAIHSSGILEALCNKATFGHLTVNKLRQLEIPWPQPSVQRALADYLDIETGRIDTLISKRRRMINLLTERRQALITMAVSGDMALSEVYGTVGDLDQHSTLCHRGNQIGNQESRSRDPTTARRGRPVIDGGTFQLARIGHVCATVLGKMLQRTPQAPGDQRVPYLRAGLLDGLSHVRELPLMYSTGREVQVYSVIEGDLLVAEGGDMGRSEFTPRLPERTIFQNSLHRIRLRSDGDIRFVRYALMAIHSSGILEALCNKATFGHLTVDKLRQLEIPWPQPSVQRALADYLDIETGRIDALLSKERRIIDLLAERHQALITAAVSGELAISGVTA